MIRAASFPSGIERLAATLARPRVLLMLLVAAIGWMTCNLALSSFGFHAPDAFPFHWLQRALLLVNLTVLFVCLRARAHRVARERRRAAEQQALTFALRSAFDMGRGRRAERCGDPQTWH